MDTLLVLNADPELEEDLIDYLLQAEGVGGFTAQFVLGHGTEGRMTLAEQVAGRRRRIQVQVALEAAAVPAVLAGLAAQVGPGIVWWQHALAGFGRSG